MLEGVRAVLTSQYVAALRMLRDAVVACPPNRWAEVVGTRPFAGVAYHALFFADLYLSPGEAAFELRDVHRRGGDPRRVGFDAHLPPADTLAYADLLIANVADAMAAETAETLRSASGFSWLQLTRGELHHAGGLATVVRRHIGPSSTPDPMDWVDHGTFPAPPAVRP